MRSPTGWALLVLLLAAPAAAQDPYPGLTIISTRTSTESYLIDMDQNVVRTWQGADVPAEFAYMLPDSSVLRPCRVIEAEGRGGRVQRIDAHGVVVWDFLFADIDYLQHHDIEPLPNGNVLMVAWERRTIDEAVQAGRQNVLADMKTTYLVEIEPEGPTGGNVVWEWRVWDHLIQDADPTKDNYGVVGDHPELMDVNFGDEAGATWLHTNAIDYNAELDQVVISSRNTSEIYVIDHGASTAEAASHEGGRRGRGGDFLYRWGNPQAYRRGDAADQVLWGVHGSVWIDKGLPGAGNIMVFNNGDRPGTLQDRSSVEEILPPQAEPGVYVIEPDRPFGPATTEWYYGDIPGFYSSTLGGAYRLPNGNTLICQGTSGVVFEVTDGGTTIWAHVAGAPVHRAPRYWAPVAAAPAGPPPARLVDNRPNPFNPTTTITFTLAQAQRVTIVVSDIAGRTIATIADRTFGPGLNSVAWSGRDAAGHTVPSGTYLVRMETEDGAQARKISLVR
jgi:hypothetical protein